MTEFTHMVVLSSSYYLIRDSPGDNYGISACRVHFYCIGPKGAVQFVIGTDWYCAQAVDHLRSFARSSYDERSQPIGWDLGFHAREPKYKWHDPLTKHCDVIN